VFYKGLLKTTRYRTSGNKLELYAADQPLASFLDAEKNWRLCEIKAFGCPAIPGLRFASSGLR